MKRKLYFPTMVQAITVLTVLKMMTKAQTSCNQGLGRIMYERLPNQQLQGFDDDVVRDTAPPFQVLEKCQDLCLRDRTAANNIVRTCSSFDFQPGSRIASFTGQTNYEESTCYLTSEQAGPVGLGQLMLVPNSIHFTEVCVTSNRPERECPMRRYIFERHPRKKLKLPSADIKEMQAVNRTECENFCLNEFSFVCRSATFDSSMRMCRLSRFTRRTHPDLLVEDPNSDYLENTCLNAERRCDGLAVFIKEENRRLAGPFEAEVFTNMTLEECQASCVRAEKYFCRSIEFDDMTKLCILFEEDSISQRDDIQIGSSPSNHFYDLVCLDNHNTDPGEYERENTLNLIVTARGSEYPDNSVTSHLFSNGRRPDTAFQRYRNSRLGGEFHSEITGRSLSECLDECLRQTSFQCRSAVYSDRFKTCRLSRFNQRDGMRIIYDADYDYYENLMHHLMGDDNESGHTSRPDPDRPGYPGGDPNRPNRWRPRPPYDYDKRYPSTDGRYPPTDGRYPPTDGRYPSTDGRYPPTDGRYPSTDGRYPPTDGRYPPTDGRYPSTDGRYPPTDGRYPPWTGDRYEPGGLYPNRIPTYDKRPGYPDYDRYSPNYGKYPVDPYIMGKYPIRGRPPPDDRYLTNEVDYPDRRYPDDGRYPIKDDRYPPKKDRYPNRYPIDDGRYPIDSRYPIDRGRYPADTRYPDSSRYPIDTGRYPTSGKYPMDERYPIDTRYPIDGRYPPVDSRYPIDNGRYPVDGKYPVDGRYPIDSGRYPVDGRYPPSDRRYPDYYYRTFLGGNRYLQRPPILDGYDSNIRPIDGPDYEGPVGPRPPVPPIPPANRPPGEPGAYRPGGYNYRCDDDNFKQVGVRQRARRPFIRRYSQAPSLMACQRECVETREFICRAFNYRDNGGYPPTSNSIGGYGGAAPYEDPPNCELSDHDTRDLDLGNPAFFETNGQYDFYERSLGRNAEDGECLDVSQECNEEGMTFTLRLPEGFYGRIYTYGFYDRCFFRGNGGTANVLRISGAQGYPECGTQRYGDTMTNIVVVQFSDFVQTAKDKRYNLTCLFKGPGEAVVTSGYIGAGWGGDSRMSRSGNPVPIEYLPAENSLSSKVRLLILYQGRPTNTIAVGDPLTFRLEPLDGHNYLTDIFATNVIARDPYSGRSVQLIDRYGCPVDSFVFPELDRARESDALETRFNAFKIPESNFLVFEATVRTCRDGCQPAYCTTNNGRSEPSFGKRRRRSLIDSIDIDKNGTFIINSTINDSNDTQVVNSDDDMEYMKNIVEEENENNEQEFVRELIKVLDSREELKIEARKMIDITGESVCMNQSEYYAYVIIMFIMFSILLIGSIFFGWAYKKYYKVILKSSTFNDNFSHKRNLHSPYSNSSYPTCSSYQKSCPSSQRSATNISLFASGIQKTFGPKNLSKVCDFVRGENRSPSTSSLSPLDSTFEDPSEPIYTDPSLFERSRSLRSVQISQSGQTSSISANIDKQNASKMF